MLHTSRILAACVIVLAAFCCADSAAIRRHDGDKVISFKAVNLDQLKWLYQLHEEEGVEGKLGENIRFWFGPAPLQRESVVFVPRESYQKFLAAIPRSETAWWTVQQENLGRLVEQERRLNSGARAPHTSYLRYQQIIDFLNNQASTCGSFCEVEDFGSSFEGRRLQLIKIGDTSSRKRIIWIDAGIHAREWIAPATAVYFIDKLIEGYRSKDAGISSLLEDFTIYIAPLLNPDGYEYTFTNNRYWRKTRSVQTFGCRGVDPNRNFGYKWGGKGTSSSPCSDIYRGQSSFSESETQAVRDRVQKDASRTIAYITVHSYGQMWLLPYGYDYNVNAPNFDQMLRAAQAAVGKLQSGGTTYQVGNSAVVIYPAAGSSDDWARSIGIPFSQTLELPDTGRYGFNLPASEILKVGRETLEALLEYLKAVKTEVSVQRKP